MELNKLLAQAQPPRIVLHDFVDDPAAVQAAAAVRCAAERGRAQHVRKYLLEHEPPGRAGFSPSALAAVARLAGMGVAQLRACTASQKIRMRVEADTQAARRLGFDQPPAFIAEGVPLSGMQPAKQLAAALSGKPCCPSGMNDLPKLKDFPTVAGGSGEAVQE